MSLKYLFGVPAISLIQSEEDRQLNQQGLLSLGQRSILPNLGPQGPWTFTEAFLGLGIVVAWASLLGVLLDRFALRQHLHSAVGWDRELIEQVLVGCAIGGGVFLISIFIITLVKKRLRYRRLVNLDLAEGKVVAMEG